MKILKRLCAVFLIGCLFLCGSGFGNGYKDVQTVTLEKNSSGCRWKVQTREYSEPEKKEKCSEYKSKRGKVKVTHTFKSDSKDDSICDADGKDIFEIRGVKEGTVTLEFVLVKNDDDCEYIDGNKTIWVNLCVNESKQVEIVGFRTSDWCCVNKK